MQQYFLGLGSNIQPEQHFPQIIEALFQWSDQVDLSKIYRVRPMNMESDNYFLNAVARIQTNLDKKALKANLSTTEIAMGRNRSDPNSKQKDRPADIDILLCLSPSQTVVNKDYLPDEIYARQPLLELLHHLNFEITVPEINALNTVFSLKWHEFILGTAEMRLQQTKNGFIIAKQ